MTSSSLQWTKEKWKLNDYSIHLQESLDFQRKIYKNPLIFRGKSDGQWIEASVEEEMVSMDSEIEAPVEEEIVSIFF